jgi:hypothetical protein
MNQVTDPQQLVAYGVPLAIDALIFHPAPPCSFVIDPRSRQLLRLDGWWKTRDGRTLYAACSAAGSILRTPEEIPHD